MTWDSPPCAGDRIETVIHSTLSLYLRSMLMSRPVVKSAIRIALFASALAAAACTSVTSPTDVNSHKQAVKDDEIIPVDSLSCRSGYTVIQGRVVCNPDPSF